MRTVSTTSMNCVNNICEKQMMTDQNQSTYNLKQLVLYFLKLGTTGLGGPVTLAGYMH